MGREYSVRGFVTKGEIGFVHRNRSSDVYDIHPGICETKPPLTNRVALSCQAIIYTYICPPYRPRKIAAILLWLAVAVWLALEQAGAGAPTDPTELACSCSTSPFQIALCVAALIEVGTRRAGPSALAFGLKLATKTQRCPDSMGSPAWVTLPGQMQRTIVAHMHSAHA